MYSTKLARGAMIIRRHTLLQATGSSRSGNAFFERCFASGSTSLPPEDGSEGVGEKAKQTMDDVLGTTKDTSQKLKERVMGTGKGTTNTEKPSQNPDLNHGVETTDSSCEDVRGRPGGYS